MSTPGPNAPRKQSTKSQKSTTRTEKEVKGPPKELMDRLIYGERAQVSKKEMYALTRKNYENLPEVVAKRREEEKRKKEA